MGYIRTLTYTSNPSTTTHTKLNTTHTHAPPASLFHAPKLGSSVSEANTTCAFCVRVFLCPWFKGVYVYVTDTRVRVLVERVCVTGLKRSSCLVRESPFPSNDHRPIPTKPDHPDQSNRPTLTYLQQREDGRRLVRALQEADLSTLPFVKAYIHVRSKGLSGGWHGRFGLGFDQPLICVHAQTHA